MDERKVEQALEAYKAEAVRTLVDAFNEGFKLGAEHAEREFNR